MIVMVFLAVDLYLLSRSLVRVKMDFFIILRIVVRVAHEKPVRAPEALVFILVFWVVL